MVKRLHRSSSTGGFTERGMEVRRDPSSLVACALNSLLLRSSPHFDSCLL